MAVKKIAARWLSDKATWRLDLQKEGQRKSFYSSQTGRRGKKECEEKAQKWLDGKIQDDTKHLDELYAAFLESKKQRTGTCDYIKYDSFGKVWLLPALGAKRFCRVTEQDLQSIIDIAGKTVQANGTHYSRKTLLNFMAMMRGFYKWCRMSGYTTMALDNLSVPENARYKKHTILQPQGVATLFQSDKTFLKGKEVHDDFIHAYRFAVLTGLRPGELRALRWENIEGKLLHVEGSKNQLNEMTNGKNGNALRTIALGQYALRVLKDQYDEYGYTQGIIFPILSMQNFYKRWKKYCCYNGIEALSLYEMRHTFVSIVKTMPEADVKFLVGHSQSMDTFGVYGHSLLGDGERIATQVDSIFQSLLGDGA